MKCVSSLSNGSSHPLPVDELLRNSLLYRELAAEHAEILKHKWIESEKAGHDIGYEQAHMDWRLKHGSEWRKWRRERQRLHLDC